MSGFKMVDFGFHVLVGPSALSTQLAGGESQFH